MLGRPQKHPLLLDYPESMSEGKGALARFPPPRKTSVMEEYQEETHKKHAPTAATPPPLSQHAGHHSLQDSPLILLFLYCAPSSFHISHSMLSVYTRRIPWIP